MSQCLNGGAAMPMSRQEKMHPSSLTRRAPARAPRRSRRSATRGRLDTGTHGFPTLTWQSAHRLAEAHAASGRVAHATSAAILAAETIERMAAEAPDTPCRETLLAWPRVQTAFETLERVRCLA